MKYQNGLIGGSLLLLTLSLLTVHAREVRTTVSYVSHDAVFLEAGRENGIQVGDRADIFHDERLTASLGIIFVAEKSASCRIPEGSLNIAVGDVAIVHTADSSADPQLHSLSDPSRPAIPLPQIQPVKSSGKSTVLSGRISLRTYVQDEQSTLNNDYQEPSLAVNGKLSRIGGSLWNASVRLRLRKDLRARSTSSATESQWDNRIYEATFAYGDDYSRYNVRAGRFTANSLSGIGYIDGALASVKTAKNVSVGLFGGTQPDLRTTDFQTEEVKSGLFASYASPPAAATNWNAALALAGRYREGQISREFIYEQLQYADGSRFRFYENMEINLNRDWLKTAEGSSLTLSSLMTGLNWSPAKWLSAELSYSNRRNYFTYETRHIADSLFDDAVRQGVRTSLRVRSHGWFIGLAGNRRTIGSDYSAGESYSVNGGSTNLLRTLTNVELRWTAYDNEYSSGDQPAIRIQRPVFATVSLGIEAGEDRYQFKSSSYVNLGKWYRLNAEWRASKHVFGSTYSEFREEDLRRLDRHFIELGYRF